MMEYTTNDLSRILDVSTNTIRSFGEKGHLRVSRDEENGYVLGGDAMALKIGFSKEDGREWQYVLMHMPVDRE